MWFSENKDIGTRILWVAAAVILWIQSRPIDTHICSGLDNSYENKFMNNGGKFKVYKNGYTKGY